MKKVTEHNQRLSNSREIGPCRPCPAQKVSNRNDATKRRVCQGAFYRPIDALWAAPTPCFGNDFALFAGEKFCPLFQTVDFAFAVVPKSLHTFLSAKLPQCVSVADETKSAVTLITAVRR